MWRLTRFAGGSPRRSRSRAVATWALHEDMDAPIRGFATCGFLFTSFKPFILFQLYRQFYECTNIILDCVFRQAFTPFL